MQRQTDGNLQVNVEGLRRVRIDHYIETEPFFIAQISDLRGKAGRRAGRWKR